MFMLISLVNKNQIFKRRNTFLTKIVLEKDTGEFSQGGFSLREFSSGEFTKREFDESGFSAGEFDECGFFAG